MTKRRLLALTALTLATAAPAYAQTAPDQAPAAVDEVVITGSRIPRTKLEGAAPVTVITAQDIDSKAFRSVFDALTQATQNTGSVQGEDFGSTFTPAANVINLRGLGPNHTLVLLNGRRMADYPVAYDGSVNAVNLANIPSAAISQIEILTGGAGAVYGSDAIAGVVNLKTRRQADGLDLSVRYGGTEQGGGENWRVQAIGGRSFGKLDVTAEAEFSGRDPIWWRQRDLSNAYTRYAKPGVVPPAMFSNRNPATKVYYDPPAGACAALAGLQGGTMTQYPAVSGGSYCSSDGYYNYRTIQTERDVAAGHVGLTYHVDDRTEVFGDLFYGHADVKNVVRSLSWSRTFWNNASGRLETWNRVFTPEEMGGEFGAGSRYAEDSWNAAAGVRGRIGEDWRYELAYNRSEYSSDQGRVRLLAGIDDFFRGPQQGTHSAFGGAYAAFTPAPGRLYTPLTPAEFGALSANFVEQDRSYLQDFSLSANGPLFALPAGPLQAALVLEAGDQGFENNPDPRINQGAAWNTGQTTRSSGHRNRQAVGVELRAPIFAQLTATLAERYDNYSYGGQSVGAETHSVGLEYRPTSTLLLRGSYSTSFRAPDMSYVFETQTRGYYPGVTDYYQCRLAGQAYSSCNIQYNMNFLRTGSAALKPEEGRSFTVGGVWSPNRHFDLQLDYYDIEISNEVTSLNQELILKTEADCRLGRSVSGAAVDPNSAICRDYVARVDRTPGDAAVNPNQVNNITVNPINASSERTRGLDASANLRWRFDQYGAVLVNLTYTKVFEHTYQQFSGDPKVDYVRDPAHQADWSDRATASLTWDIGRWTATLYGVRYGAIPRNDASGSWSGYAVFNGSVRYRLTDRAAVSLIVNNIADRYPVDKSGGWPYYPVGWYDEYGRQTWLQLDYRFGPKSGR